MNFHFPCHWLQMGKEDCGKIAEYVIIYSCWNEHLHDLPVCDKHMTQWKTEIQTDWLYCAECDSIIAEYDKVDASKVNMRYLRTRGSLI